MGNEMNKFYYFEGRIFDANPEAKIDHDYYIL